jgi:hypothetical protein
LSEFDSVVATSSCSANWKTPLSLFLFPAKPSHADINQILAYAHFKQSDRVATHRAILIYPESLPQPLDTISGRIHLQSLTFGCDRDTSGAAFLAQLQL